MNVVIELMKWAAAVKWLKWYRVFIKYQYIRVIVCVRLFSIVVLS